MDVELVSWILSQLSNGTLVREARLDRIEVPLRRHFVRTELPPEEAAAEYDRGWSGSR